MWNNGAERENVDVIGHDYQRDECEGCIWSDGCTCIARCDDYTPAEDGADTVAAYQAGLCDRVSDAFEIWESADEDAAMII